MWKKSYLSRLVYSVLALLLMSALSFGETINVSNSTKAGFSKLETNRSKTVLKYSVPSFELNEINSNTISGKRVSLKNVFLPNQAGAPDLAVESKMLMVPTGAKAVVKIKDFNIKTFKNIDIAPASEMILENDKSPLRYKKNNEIYSRDEFYPISPVMVSDTKTLRGIDYVNLSVSPFQYNPVTRVLKVYSNIEFEVSYEGGNGNFGENKYRDRYFDTVLKNAFYNSELFPEVDYNVRSTKENEDFNYVIITPNDPDFINWANVIKEFRTKQGIRTGIFTTDEIGGNTINAIDNFVNEAYNWDIPVASVLLLGDYGNSGNTITSPTRPHPYSGECISDNLYADIDGDHLPDINFARITARDAYELEIMVNKFINYETNPPQNENFYNKPITALGWQTERWFQICSEVVGGFWANNLGKETVRINAVYDGNPNIDPWSTAPNTDIVVDVFGPNNLGYIPATPGELSGWTGGSAIDVNNALNGDGAFMLQHRDHGEEVGWGEPSYGISNLDGLNTENLPYIFSINCLTGKFNIPTETFAEAIHRKANGALGILAATDVSYSFVNDTFVWGLYDSMWPEFLPEMGSEPSDNDMILPSFGSVAGKYFLSASSWPYNPESKEITYDLFHQHGDAYMNVYSEMPQELTVSHNGALLSGVTSYAVSADAGAIVALTVDGNIIGTGTATGSPTEISIDPQLPGKEVTMVVTKQNYIRYEESFTIIPPEGPYPVYNQSNITDADGNGIIENGDTVSIEAELKNVGNEVATNVTAILSSESEYVNEITQNSASVVTIDPNMGVATLSPSFDLSFVNNIPDQTEVPFKLEVDDQTDENKESYFSVTINAPLAEFSHTSNIGFPGSGDQVEYSVTIENNGHSNLTNLELLLTSESNSEYYTIENPSINIEDLPFGESIDVAFNVSYDNNIPLNTTIEFDLTLEADKDFSSEYQFNQLVNNPIIIENNFDLFPGEGWSIEGGQNWVAGNGNYSGGTPPEAKFTWSPSTTGDQYLISPVINTAGFSEMKLEYRHSVDHYGQGYELKLVSSSDGENWTELKSFPAENTPATLDSVILNPINCPELGSNTFRFAFLFSGNSFQINNWYVDDVKLLDRSQNPVGIDEIIPAVTSLYQNYPNPFNPTTTIRFDLANDSDVKLLIYNARGQMVEQLVNNHLRTGIHTVNFDAKAISSGLYYYKLIANNKVMTKKMLLVK
ncbi:MAG: hypothetical protein CR982_06505 [Candidatus Cloacimonadota bacterium]|nr:MAG: hypothetical protein CR982_06505 [Candidatus Cloacimonadota bacterium]PIE79940.1 MAG: hypothetical protein CSA15_02425 [Candidatus Delongbacteria bacterium]